ncbi:MAG: hypothetical protein EOO05_08295 [Chitinophagaceae bacterium]|nr:MAG: hypothetical protein EOO05_08295 [Chitinophagaceae bacterium]
MKNYRIHLLTLTFLLAAGIAQAQKQSLINEPDLNKPKLFAQLPARIPVEVADLEKLISNNPETGKDATLDLNGKGSATFAGKVVSTASKYGNSIRSIVIRSTSFNGATFSLSATQKEDGTIHYTGRIISFKHGDLYELQSENNQYFLVKKNYYELVAE